jgi:predicted methyltransferase
MTISICRRAGAAGLIAALAMFAMQTMAPVKAEEAPDYAAIVGAPDRSDADRQTDQRRQPAKLLAFTGVRPGMKVLDMEAGSGYSTELLARAVASFTRRIRLPSWNASRTNSTSAQRSPR